MAKFIEIKDINENVIAVNPEQIASMYKYHYPLRDRCKVVLTSGEEIRTYGYPKELQPMVIPFDEEEE